MTFTSYSVPHHILVTILICYNPCSGQAKPNKKAKVTKPTTAPEVAEPEQQISAPEASDKLPDETVTDTPPEIPGLCVDDITFNPSNPTPSSSLKPSETHANDVLITSTGFIEPGNPTVLAKHSAKQEVIERRKVRFDVSHYA